MASHSYQYQGKYLPTSSTKEYVMRLMITYEKSRQAFARAEGVLIIYLPYGILLSRVSVNFIDFQKAFYSVHSETLWKILHSYGSQEIC